MATLEALGRLTFLGGAGTVTGSKTLLETRHGRVLVDCGLFQGAKDLRLHNWDDLAVPADTLDAVLLTHAHLDHCGHLPRLVRQGFAGPVYCTAGTRRLAEIVLADSGRLQEEQATHANEHGYSKHSPALPLYTEEEARACFPLLTEVRLDAAVELVPGATATWRRAGHILGAASVRLGLDEDGPAPCRVVFSGDHGRPTHPLLQPPEPIGPAEVVVTESTYGDETHPPDDAADAIAGGIRAVADSGGVLIVPAFSVDRTEVVLWHLDRLVREGRVPRLPVYLDSPMALRALAVYEEAALAGAPEIRPEYHGRPLFPDLDLIEVTTVEQSKSLNDRPGPFVIVSASGMVTGGRVVHHLANRLGSRRNMVMLVGFQAPGTRGASLADGAETLRMLGQEYAVRARVLRVPLSSHADRDELLAWLATATGLRRVVVNHGEPEATEALVRAARSRLGVRVSAARPGGVVALGVA